MPILNTMPSEFYNESRKLVSASIVKIGRTIKGAQNTEILFEFLKKKYRDNDTIKFEVEADFDMGYHRVIATCPSTSALMSVMFETAKRFINSDEFYFDEPYLIEERWA